MQRFITVFSVLALMFSLALVSCPDDASPGGGVTSATAIPGLALSDFTPVEGAPQITSVPTNDYCTGTIIWKQSTDNVNWTAMSNGATFMTGVRYRAELSLTAKPGYTFTGIFIMLLTATRGRFLSNTLRTANPAGGGYPWRKFARLPPPILKCLTAPTSGF